MLAAFLKTRCEVSPRLTLPPIQWIIDEPVVQNITGARFAVPIMEFGRGQLDLLNRLTGTTGIEISIPIELVSLGAITSQDSIESRLLLMADKSVPSSIPYIERRQHEFAHAIDPYAHSRTEDALTMNELVAIVGSFADDEGKIYGVNLVPGYINPYILEQAKTMGNPLTQEEFVRQASLVEHLVKKSTSQYELGKKVLNDEAARRLMACRNFSELRQRWPKIFNFTLIQ